MMPEKLTRMNAFRGLHRASIAAMILKWRKQALSQPCAVYLPNLPDSGDLTRQHGLTGQALI